MSENKIELFVQGEEVREVTLIRVPHDGIVRDIIKSVSEQCGIEAREEGPLGLRRADQVRHQRA